jgi:pimeloyl-ACP methyl ester carboxylesterase
MLLKRDQASALTDTTFPESGSISISRGVDARSKSERFFASLDNLNPVKLPASVLVEAGGTGAWDNLVRRTRLLFHREPDLGSPAPFKRFLNRLQEEMQKPDRPAWDLTIVAHSMGTIIANQILRDFPDLPISKLVYMAAACSIRDYQDTLFPYLRITNKTAQLYHLMLHPAAEEEERSVGSLTPDGSLLVWIDEFLSNPSTPLDLTAGRFTNLLPVLRLTPDAIQARVHVTVFGAGDALLPSQPQTHGGFDEPTFWNAQGFWSSVGQPNPQP